MTKNSFRVTNQTSNSVWFMVLGVAAITICFKTDFYDPFNSAKLILLLVVSGWLSGYLVNSYRGMPIKFGKKDFIALLLTATFVIAMFVSTVLSDPFIVALIGDTQRRNGFLAYLSLSVISLYAAKSINRSNVLRVYKTAILTGLILSTYGLIQISGNDFIAWNNPYNSMISTLGNPNFASAMLAILASLSLYSLFLKQIYIYFKFISCIVIIGALFAIIESDSRQGLLALFFSIMFYTAIFAYIKNKKIGLILIVFSLIGTICAIMGMLQRGPFQATLYKDSVSVRGYYWRAGIEMLREYPLTGVGIDRYGAYFKEFREVGYPLKYGFDITSSNAHNTFIQLFATSGFFVGMAYFSLVLFIFIVGFRELKNGDLEDKKIMLGLISSWLAFQSQSLISIDNLGISVWGWLLGGSIIGLSRNREEINLKTLEDKTVASKRIAQINLFQPLLSGLILIPTIILCTLIFRFENQLYILKSYSNATTQDKQSSQNVVDSILNNPASDPYYKFQAAITLYELGDSKRAYNVINELHSKDGNNSDFLKGLIFFDNLNGDLPAAINSRMELAKIDPWNAENYLELLILHEQKGEFEKANFFKDKILSFAPNTDVAKRAQEYFG